MNRNPLNSCIRGCTSWRLAWNHATIVATNRCPNLDVLRTGNCCFASNPPHGGTGTLMIGCTRSSNGASNSTSLAKHSRWTTLRLIRIIVSSTSHETLLANWTADACCLWRCHNDAGRCKFASLAALSAKLLWRYAQCSTAESGSWLSWCAATFVISTRWKSHSLNSSKTSSHKSACGVLILGFSCMTRMRRKRLMTDWQSDQIPTEHPQCFAYFKVWRTATSSDRNALCCNPLTAPAITIWLLQGSPLGCAWTTAQLANLSSFWHGHKQLPSVKMSIHCPLLRKGAMESRSLGIGISNNIFCHKLHVSERNAHPWHVKLGGSSGIMSRTYFEHCCLSAWKTSHSQICGIWSPLHHKTGNTTFPYLRSDRSNRWWSWLRSAPSSAVLGLLVPASEDILLLLQSHFGTNLWECAGAGPHHRLSIPRHGKPWT